jgi:hypothetical protein
LRNACSKWRAGFALQNRALQQEQMVAKPRFPQRPRQRIGFHRERTRLVERPQDDCKLAQIPQRHREQHLRARAAGEVQRRERLAARTPIETEVAIRGADVGDDRGHADNIARCLVRIQRLRIKAQRLRKVGLGQRDVVERTGLTKQVAAAPRKRERFGRGPPGGGDPVGRP